MEREREEKGWGRGLQNGSGGFIMMAHCGTERPGRRWHVFQLSLKSVQVSC